MGAKNTGLEFKNYFPAVVSETFVIIMQEQCAKQSTGSSMKGSQSECSRRETVRVDSLCSEILGRFGSAIDESGDRHSEEWTVRNLPPHSNSVVPPSSANKIGGLLQIPGLLSAHFPFAFKMDWISGPQFLGVP